ncbi:Disease resistance RPP13-like protein 4 [Camellia lanceoleosa]|uniref:Disease resistance RPP13-like protein 4 n=1 Tax=Camellia lanceoleosa TaxID=1840588 RepID=A0ACC0GMW9_9ERIC|nr:Disease resistance RPP13-like protein 4 [Camellia lanceoleosa]
MSTQPPDHPSSSATSNEIEEVEQDTNNPTQINNNNNSREIDNPKEKRHKNSKKPKSIDTATNMDPRSNDGDNNKSNSEAKAEAEAKAKAEAEAEAEAEALHKLIGADLSSIKNASERINKYEEPIKLVSDRFKKFEQKRGSADEYRELKKVVKKLKQQISSKHKDDDSDAARKLWSIDSTNITGADADKLLEEMPNLYKNEAFEKSLDFKEFKERYDELDLELKLCLLSFSVFPENVEIKKRVMLYWWIGEGFVPPVPRKDTVANTAAAANTVPNALANTVANTASNTVPNTVANAAANTVPNALANTVANTAPNTVPNTVANAAVNTVPNALANTASNTVLNTAANTASNTVLNTAANTAANTVPNALANTVANTASNTVPNTVANAAANTAPNTVPNTVANAAANTVPNALANAVANTASNTVPNTVANTAPNTVPNTVANAAANTVPNVVAPNTVSNTAAQETNDKKTPEQFANEFFKKLIEKGFIQPVYKKRSVGVDICKMHPFVRSMVVKLAKKAKFFNFDDEGNATENYSGSLRACLKGKGLKNFEELDKLHTLFNVNEAILDFKPEWFSKMKNLNVLYLGRWQTSPTHHIEVEDTAALKIKNANVLDGLEDIRHLRFLSLQGISRVTELPESISKLSNLMILDIRACHNLEIIPNGMGLLKNLTHLDMSECYLLDQMPKGLSLLSKLQVLSGFVVGDSESKNSCTIKDLRKLPELRKLSIHTGVDAFPLDSDLRALNQFKKLTKLTIAWGRGSVEAKKDDSRKNDIGASEQEIAATKKPGLQKALTRLPTSKFAEVSNPELPSQLIKLDLQSFPRMVTPPWLRAFTLKNLKKLYIRGGKFSDLGQFKELEDEELEKDKWKVEELRLKYLTDLEMNWRELQELFPDLTYLEKVNCPKLTFFPCDESGVWMNKTMGD